jgi:hypothetical protein
MSKENESFYRMKRARYVKPGRQTKSPKIISIWLIYHQLTVLSGGGIVTTCYSESSVLCLHNFTQDRIVSLCKNQLTFSIGGTTYVEDL